MSESEIASQDGWLWVVDEKLVAALFAGDVAATVGPNSDGSADGVLAEPDAPPDESAVQAAETVAVLPAAVDPLWTQASRWFQSGQPAEALQAYRELAGKRSGSSSLAYNAAVCLRQLGRYGEAVQEFERALQTRPDFSEASIGLSWCLLHLKRADEALARFEVQLENSPADVHASQGRAQALHLLSRTEEANAAYLDLLARDPGNPDILANLIAISAEQRDAANLRHYSEYLLKAKTRSRQAIAGIITADLAEGHYESAIRHATEFLEIEPRSYEAWFNLGLASQLQGNHAEAAKAYREATNLNEARVEPYVNLGYLLIRGKDLAQAKSMLDRALRLQPDHALAQWNMALVLEGLASYPEAAAYFQKLTEKNPENMEGAFRLGMCELRQGDWPASIQAFENCVERRKDWVDAWICLGVAHWSNANMQAAGHCLDQALGLDPGRTPALECRAAIALAAGDVHSAPELEARLADLGHSTPEFCYNLGVLQFQAGQYDQAAHSFRRAVGKKPAFGDAMINLGYTLEALGQHDQAVEALRNAISVKPELPSEYFHPA